MATVRIEPVLPDMNKLARQAEFAAALALTRTAQGAQAAVTQELPHRFDRPNPFTMRAVAIKPARRTELVAWVYVRPDQAAYLGIQETGGRRVGQRGDPVNLPVGVRTNQYGNIPRSFWQRLRIAKPYVGAGTLGIRTKRRLSSYGGGVFVARRGEARTAHLPPGIYERAPYRRRLRGKVEKSGTTVKLLVAWHRAADYKARFGFEPNVTGFARREFQRQFGAALRQALATAR